MTHRLNSVTISRDLAVKALNRIDKGLYAERALSEVLSETRVFEKDRSLTTEIVYGTVRWRMRLDSTIDKFLRYDGKLKSEIRNVLRIAFYQLFFLNRIPAHSIVHQAVAQAKNLFEGKFSGLVNAILRSALRNPEVYKSGPTGNAQSLSVYYSHPEWLVKNWLARFGAQQTVQILEFNNQRARLTLRVNCIKAHLTEVIKLFEKEGLVFDILCKDRGSLTVRWIGRPVTDLPGFKEGLFAIQDYASQMIAPILKAEPSNEILDVGGAPGGKAAHIAALVNNRARINLLDVSMDRLDEARKNLERLGINCVKIIHGDATQKSFILSLGEFDRILIDAPCSNLGVLRHNCDVKYRLNPNNLIKLAEKQLVMLSESAGALKKGGILVYCVCSTSCEETTQVIEKFLASNKKFVIYRIEPEEISHPNFLTQEGYLLTFPPVEQFPVDGFFAARIKRN